MKQTNIEIKRIFEDFDRHNVKYAVIRNYEFLLKDEIYSGGDVDIVVFKKDKNILKNIVSRHSFRNRRLNPFSNHFGCEKMIAEDEKMLRLHFHLGGIVGRHVKYLDAESILKRRIKSHFFYHLSKEDEFLAILLHSMLDLAEIKRYEQDLTGFHELDLYYIEEQLSKIFNRNLVNKIIKFCKEKDFSKLNSVVKQAKIQFERKNILKILGVYLFGAIWKLFYFKLAPVISLTGMDGTGKTTNLEYIKNILSKNHIKYFVFYGGRGRDNLLPIQFLGKLYRTASKEKLKSQLSEEEKQMKPKRSPIKTIVYTVAAPIFAADLFLRYWFKIFPKRFKSEYIITDRFSTDMLLMQNVPFSFKKFLYLFLPKAIKTIYLYNKPEILFKRKTDQPYYDLIRQEKLFNKINKTIKPIKIKSEGLEKTKLTVLNSVF